MSLGNCERLVQAAMARGADQAEAFWSTESGMDVELESGHIASTGSGRSQGGALRILKEGRTGFAYLTDIMDAAATADAALRHARSAAPTAFRLPCGSKAELAPRYDEAHASLDAAELVRLAKELVASAAEVDAGITTAGGGASVEVQHNALASSEGTAVEDRLSTVSIHTSLVLNGIAHWDHKITHGGLPDAVTLATDAAKRVVSLQKPSPADGDALVFLPESAGELLGLVTEAATGDDAMRGRTVYTDRLGKQVANEGLNVTDDPLLALALGVDSFDGDGLPVTRTPIIADGVLRNYLFDAFTAADHGATSTHSAVRGSFKARPVTGMQHLHITHKDTRDVMDGFSGLLVGSVLGAHTANSTTGEFSITAPNVWQVKDGEVRGAAKEVAIAGNLDRLLAGIVAVGTDVRYTGGSALPSLLVEGLDVSR